MENCFLYHMKLYRLHYLVSKSTYEFLSETTFRRSKSVILDFQNRAVSTKLNQILNAFGFGLSKQFSIEIGY